MRTELHIFLDPQVYLGGFAFGPQDETVHNGVHSNHTNGLFNWHPLLMALAFQACMTEGINIYLSIKAPKHVPSLPSSTGLSTAQQLQDDDILEQ
jgi:hypothetical protein